MANPPRQDPPSRALVSTAGALFALVAMSGAAGMVASALPMPRPAWTLFGFEVVVTTAGVLGWLFTRQGCRTAPGMGLGSLALCIGVGSALGYFSVQRHLAGVSLTPLLLARALLAAAIGGLAVIAALGKDRRRWTDLIVGALLGVPVVIAVGIAVLPAGGRLLERLPSIGGMGSFIVGTLVFLLLTALASASAHLVIRSFQGTLGVPREAAAAAPGSATNVASADPAGPVLPRVAARPARPPASPESPAPSPLVLLGGLWERATRALQRGRARPAPVRAVKAPAASRPVGAPAAAPTHGSTVAPPPAAARRPGPANEPGVSAASLAPRRFRVRLRPSPPIPMGREAGLELASRLGSPPELSDIRVSDEAWEYTRFQQEAGEHRGLIKLTVTANEIDIDHHSPAMGLESFERMLEQVISSFHAEISPRVVVASAVDLEYVVDLGVDSRMVAGPGAPDSADVPGADWEATVNITSLTEDPTKVSVGIEGRWSESEEPIQWRNIHRALCERVAEVKRFLDQKVSAFLEHFQ